MFSSCCNVNKCKWTMFVTLCFIVFSCGERKTSDKVATLFQKLDSAQTKIDFKNTLSYDERFNVYTYRNFYNGGGVAIGDINNDSLPDIFFTANMLPNKLYLNKGNFQFEDVTEKAGIGKKGQWSTGVSMADINGDGWLDIYVCNSGDIKGDSRENELYINNGNGTFVEKANEYGIADKGLSTHAAFFDYDKDGDLDMFLLNNSFKAIGSFNLKENERNKRDSIGGHKFFRNDANHFTDISEQAHIYGSVIGFGLGVTVGDVDNDGWQDIYVSNDFFERDYLYINNQDGTFKEKLEEEMMSISNASMGADMADINNDRNPEIFVTEMLPDINARLKVNTTFENWDKYQLDLKYDYYHQFTRNMLQLNNGNHTFSEIGRYAGVSSTDWSWGALITDLDNDGLKDIFVANGIYQDLTNQDYIQYVSNESFYKKVISGKANYKELIDLIPSEGVSNYAFMNKGDLRFENRAKELGLEEPSFSNGSAYGDLDNDGDLDLVVNNVNMPCFVYKNRSREQNRGNNYLKVSLQGEGKNSFGIGSKVTLYYGGTLGYQEQMPVRGFESTVDSRLNFGIGKSQQVDSVEVIWNDGRRTLLKNIQANQHLFISQKDALLWRQGSVAASAKPLFQPISESLIPFTHHENAYSDFDRDLLLYQMLSTQGPRIAKGDVNKDGLDDLYICGAKGQIAALYVQQKEGGFVSTNKELLARNKDSEDTDALFFDADGDGDQDLYVCSGGNEYQPNSTDLIDKLYINDGQGRFSQSPQILPSFTLESSSCVRASDYDGDGDQDLFVGVRLKLMQYGLQCKAYVLNNDGKGVFTNATSKVCPALETAGMITDGQWVDYDRDGKEDLIIAGEYIPIRIFKNSGKKTLEETTEQVGLNNTNGWWNRIQIADLNKDGYPDIVAGNHGLNSRFKATQNNPLSLYVGDYDQNGSAEQLMEVYNNNQAYPMHLRHDLVSVVPVLKKKYLKYEQYKNATMEDVLGDRIKSFSKQSVYSMSSAVFLNQVGKSFESRPLPSAAQLSPIYGICVEDFDGDGKEDILVGGNFYESKPEVGIYDASYGLLLKGDGRGNFVALSAQQSGINIRGAVRDIVTIKVEKKRILVWALNNEAVKIFAEKINSSDKSIKN